MKVLMISKSGDGLGLAHYMKIHGNEVSLWIEEDKDFEYAGLGMFEKLRNWRTALAEADLVLGDMVGFGDLEKIVQKAEKPYFGLNSGADDLELDRAGQMEILRRLQIQLPKTTSFDSPRAAEAILEMWPIESKGFVIKPSGNLETGKTFVCRDKLTYKWALSTYSGSQPLVIQEIVEGVEVSTEGWFDGRAFVPEMWNHTFEEKRFLEGNLGPNTGCMGNIVVQADPGSKLVEVVKRFEGVLRNLQYVGPFDLNAIVNESGIFALEVTPRLGYDAIEAFATMFEGDFTKTLLEFSRKSLIAPKLRGSLGAAIRVHVPPFPFSKAEPDERGRPILLPEGSNRKENLGYYLLTDAYRDAKVSDENVYFWAGSDGAVLKATMAGEDLYETLDQVYEAVSQIGLLDAGYRRDVGLRIEENVKTLEELRVL